MARIPYPEDPFAEPGARPPLNVARMLRGASPAVWHGLGALSTAFYAGSSLSPRLREIAILRVGHLSGSAYEIAQHEAVAEQVGLSAEQIAATAVDGDAAACFDAEGVAILAFTDEMVRDVRVGDAALAAVRAFLPDRTLIDLMATIGFYMFVARFLETTGVDPDERSTAWQSIRAFQS